MASRLVGMPMLRDLSPILTGTCNDATEFSSLDGCLNGTTCSQKAINDETRCLVDGICVYTEGINAVFS